MDTYRGFITYTDHEGSYSEAANFPASGWKSAQEVAMNRAVDIVRGDDLTISVKTSRVQNDTIESLTVRVEDNDEGTEASVLIVVTLA